MAKKGEGSKVTQKKESADFKERFRLWDDGFRRRVHDAVRDIQSVMKFDPPFDPDHYLDKDLVDELNSVKSQIDPSDELTRDTWNILNILGILDAKTVRRVEMRIGTTLDSSVNEKEENMAKKGANMAKKGANMAKKGAIEKKVGEAKEKKPKKVGEAVEVAKKDNGKKKKAGAVFVPFVVSLIDKGKFSRKDVIEKVMQKYPEVKRSSIQTFLTDSKNPKYNRLDKLVKEGEKGLTWEK